MQFDDAWARIESGWGALTALAVTYSFSVIGAILLMIAGYIVAGLVERGVKAALGQVHGFDSTLRHFFSQTARYLILALVLVMVLGQFGVQTASIIAAIGAIGLAIGLALQGTLQNIAAGIMLIALRPLRAGEYVAVPNGGPQGTVEEVGLFLTRLTQFDGVYISVPNSALWSSTLINYSRNPTRRLDLEVPVRYGDSLDLALEQLRRLLDEHPLVLSEPAPQVMVTEYRDNGLVVNLRMWTNNAKYWELRFDMYYKARQILDAAGLRAPVPVREIQSPRPEPEAARLG